MGGKGRGGSAMDNPFKFLRDAEWQTLAAGAEQRDYTDGDVILPEGRKATGLYVVQRGTVKVCREQAGFRITIAESGPGAIFGEMSFIEAAPADVSLIAADEVGVLFVSHAQVQAIIRDNPAFYGRFFQSLAYLLSRRLRATTGLVAAQRKGENWLVE
jgi:extracellular factor (EF) 3-hydroxypalmitic acid methyl ester biosynthesis protein